MSRYAFDPLHNLWEPELLERHEDDVCVIRHDDEAVHERRPLMFVETRVVDDVALCGRQYLPANGRKRDEVIGVGRL
ncbi:MAG TPA: hypothetical protein VLU46_05855, partial [Thermoanaerobaculia bacterium]|nr:hypothetical protein [Thermoanaerobaculia bacterium]